MKNYLYKFSLLTRLFIIILAAFFLTNLSGCSSTSTKTYKSIPSEKYSKPYYGEGYIFVIYNYKIDNNKNDEWAKIVIDGFYIVAEYSKSSDQLGVGIMYNDGSGSGYFVNNAYMNQYRDKEIDAKEFVSHIKTRDFPLK